MNVSPSVFTRLALSIALAISCFAQMGFRLNVSRVKNGTHSTISIDKEMS